MKLAIACDHGGFLLKEAVKKYLLEQEVEVEDFGCHSRESVDFPDYAKKWENRLLEVKMI